MSPPRTSDRSPRAAAKPKSASKPPPAPAPGASATTVVFVRHGATPTTGKILPGRAKGLHLSEEGQAQAEQTAEALAMQFAATSHSNGAKSKSQKVAAIYCSPMERARETAAPIAKKLGLRAKPDRSLIECDFGTWTGMELAALAKLPEWRQVQSNPSGFRFPEGESFAQMSARILGAIKAYRERHPGEVVIAVSHADPIKVALCDALGSHLNSIHRLVVSTASVSIVTYSPEGPAVVAMNSVGSLGSVGR
ncbi:MAG TPA: histidine phosphatase family protein [Acidimicrobiales bacterium]|nr:histidine phosphatase family protein [Acidimicrobiales bacterium]